jgi:hypothetical protein
MDTDILAKLIDAKHQCLGQLLEIGDRQRALIDENRMTALLDLLTVKQNVLERLQKIEAALEPYRSESPEERRWASEDHRQACAERLRQCEERLAEVIRRERESEQVLVQRRDEVSRQLHGMHHATVARSAYTAPAPPCPGQLDLSTD